jgi:serine/threonine-protein kinase SBK
LISDQNSYIKSIFSFLFLEYEPDELNPSLYSFHSNVDEKNKLLYSFSQQGIETVVDRVAKKNRIKDWIQSSIITEEEEFEVKIENSS